MARQSVWRVGALVLGLIVFLTACQPVQGNTKKQKTQPEEIRGVWVSYSEVNALLADGGLEQNYKNLLENCAALGLTDLFLHIRAFCDAIYPSEYFPLTAAAAAYEYDVLDYMIRKAHEKNIRVHGWLNPYRVRTADADFAALPEKSPAKIWKTDENPQNDTAVCVYNGIYLNPASSEVRQLILNGIREVLTAYELDGIHLDDYFYPTTDPQFDAASYAAYVASSAKPLSLAEWRTANVNALVSGCYTAVKFVDSDRIFSISPAADIEGNKTELYADVAAWCESGCVDWLIPQLYFGFEYPTEAFRYETLLARWKSVVEPTSAKLLIGLAPYKLATESEPDKAEWANTTDLLARQVTAARKSGATGVLFFSSTALFSGKEQNTAERESLKKIFSN